MLQHMHDNRETESCTHVPGSARKCLQRPMHARESAASWSAGNAHTRHDSSQYFGAEAFASASQCRSFLL